MHYQIYLPGKLIGNGEDLQAIGLGHLRGSEEYFPTPSGPDGTGGMIVAWRNGDPTARVGFYPDEQEWIGGIAGKAESGKRKADESEPLSAFSSPLYFAGFWNNAPPTPQDLQSPPGVPGMEVELGDGHRWIVPVAELLPQDVIFADGSPQAVVKKQYAGFWDESGRWFGWFEEVDLDSAIPEVFLPDLLDYVLQALNLNYRMLPELVTYSRLLDFQSILRCVAATLHKPTIDDVELEKKTAELVGIPAG